MARSATISTSRPEAGSRCRNENRTFPSSETAPAESMVSLQESTALASPLLPAATTSPRESEARSNTSPSAATSSSVIRPMLR